MTQWASTFAQHLAIPLYLLVVVQLAKAVLESSKARMLVRTLSIFADMLE